MATRLPVIGVGLPKSGTTSVFDFFACGGLNASHWKCGSSGFCGRCMHDNLVQGRPLLEGCGDYDVFAEINITPQDNALHHVDDCYFPQVSNLTELYDAAPNATWVLTVRPTANWVASVGEWPGHGVGLREKLLMGCGLPGVTTADDAELSSFYDNHNAAVRAFAASRPSLTFVEVAVEEAGAPAAMHAAFAAVPESCWGQSNCHSSCELWSEVQQQRQEEEEEVYQRGARAARLLSKASGSSRVLVASSDDASAAPTDKTRTDWWFNQVAPQCASWCAEHDDAWRSKCQWTGGTCSACPECAYEQRQQQGGKQQQQRKSQRLSGYLSRLRQLQQPLPLQPSAAPSTTTTVRVLGATETSCAVDNSPLLRGITRACEKAEGSGGSLELRVMLNLFDYDSDGGAGRNASQVASCLGSSAPLPTCATLTFVRGYKLAFWQREVTPAAVAHGKHDVVWLFDNDMEAESFDVEESARLLLASNASLAQPLVSLSIARQMSGLSQLSGEDFKQLSAANPLTPAGCKAQSVPFVEIQTPMVTAAAWATVHKLILAGLPSWLTLSSDHGVGVTWCPLLREAAGDAKTHPCAVLATPITTTNLQTINNVARKELRSHEAEVDDYFRAEFGDLYQPQSHELVSRGDCVLLE